MATFRTAQGMLQRAALLRGLGGLGLNKVAKDTGPDVLPGTQVLAVKLQMHSSNTMTIRGVALRPRFERRDIPSRVPPNRRQPRAQ